MQTYFVDVRGGCVAVRNRNYTDPEYNGLHADTPGVVYYDHGKYDRERNRWDLTQAQVIRAHVYALRLNSGAAIDSTYYDPEDRYICECGGKIERNLYIISPDLYGFGGTCQDCGETF